MAKRRKIWRRCGSVMRRSTSSASVRVVATLPRCRSLAEIARRERAPEFAGRTVEVGLAGELVDAARVVEKSGDLRAAPRTRRPRRSRCRRSRNSGRPIRGARDRDDLPSARPRRRKARATPAAWSAATARCPSESRRARSSFSLPPGAVFFSHTSTAWPARARRIAAARPPRPAPMTRIFLDMRDGQTR